MAAVVTLDRISILETNERHGALKRMVREALVSGITGVTNWEILTTALANAGVPQYGDFLTETVANNAYQMRLIERNATVLDSGKVKIELVYESTFDSEQFLDSPRGGLILGEVRCNIQQKTSNVDINGDQVTVSHTYPADDPDYPSKEKIQGGQFQYYEPQRSIIITGIKVTATPWLVANSIIGRVNSVIFTTEAVRTWLCTSCNWRPGWSGESHENNQYYMDFEYQFDPDTWDPTVVFQDDRTGQPPADLIANVGYKTVEKLPEADFEEIMGSLIQGG